MSVTTVQLLNMMDELGPLAHGAKWERVSACSDLLLQRSDGSVAIAHNEDGGLDNLGATYVVTSSVQGSAASFTAYSYPGELAGGAFGFNTLGVFFSTNAVFPKDISLKGVPRNFLQRYLLDSVNVSDAIHRGTLWLGAAVCFYHCLRPFSHSMARMTVGASHHNAAGVWILVEHRVIHGGIARIQCGAQLGGVQVWLVCLLPPPILSVRTAPLTLLPMPACYPSPRLEHTHTSTCTGG